MESIGRKEIRFVDENLFSSVISSLAVQRLSSKLCDVILRVSDTEMYAHSNVLAAASPYFDTLFSGPDLPRSFSQKNPQIIDIHIDGENDAGYGTAVQRVIDFMYTSKIKLENSFLPQITEIANIMQMTSILGFCEAFKRREEEKVRRESVKERRENVKDIVYESEIPYRNLTEVSTANADEHESPNQELVDKEIGSEGVKLTEKVKDHCLETTNPETRLIKGDGQENTFENGDIIEENDDFIVQSVLDDKTGSMTSQIVNKCEIDARNQFCLMSEVTQIPDKVVKRKRGRPRKVIQENEALHASKHNNKNESTEDEFGDPACEGENHTRAEPEKRVSRSGRVIKPRQFSDEILTDIGLGTEIKRKTKSNLLDMLDLDENKIEIEYDYDLEEEDDPSFRSSSKHCKRDENGHIQFRRYPCDKCSMNFSRIQDLHEHNRQHLHADKKCSFCGWVCESGNDEEFNTHLMKHNGKKTFFCNFCSVEFKSKTQLLLHLPRHLNSKPFICSICNAGFKWKHALKNHLVTHKGTKDYLCDICGFATAHKTMLKAHNLIHTGETFKCPYQGCLYQATKKTNLNFHLFTHTGEKPHQCDICGTSFSLVKNMRRHMLLHQTERRYKCIHCTYCSTRFDKLKEHYFKQHNIGEKPNKKFTWANYLSQEGEQVSSELKMEDGENVLSLEENMETIELEVPVEEDGLTTTQVLNLTSSTGEPIPITITQIGPDISYEIPVHLITQDGEPDQ